MVYVITCKGCGKQFASQWVITKYCSFDCMNESRRRTQIVRCETYLNELKAKNLVK